MKINTRYGSLEMTNCKKGTDVLYRCGGIEKRFQITGYVDLTDDIDTFVRAEHDRAFAREQFGPFDRAFRVMLDEDERLLFLSRRPEPVKVPVTRTVKPLDMLRIGFGIM